MDKLRSITIDELDNLQLDEKNGLYWQGKKVVIEKKVSLRWYELILATVVAIGTALTGIEALFNIIKNWNIK